MFEELLKEYRETGAQLRRVKNRAVKEPVVNSNEVILLNSMIAEVDWNIDYMENGFSKDAFRGIHRREIPMDPQVMAQLFAQKAVLSREAMYSQGNKMKAWKIFNSLSEKEAEAFWLVKVECISYGKAALEMGCSKGNVYTYILRAQEKISRIVNNKNKANTFAVTS